MPPKPKPEKFRRYVNLGWFAFLLPLALVAGVGYVVGTNAQKVMKIVDAAPSAVEPKLKQLRAIGSALPALPPLTQDSPVAVFKQLRPLPDVTNLLALNAKDLPDPLPEIPPLVPVRVCEPRVMWGPMKIARGGRQVLTNAGLLTLSEDAKTMQQKFDDLASMHWVLVVRDVDYKAPVLRNDREFEAGKFKAEALLFDFASARYVGGFRFGASIEVSVATATTVGETPLVGRLVANARASLADAIKKYMPVVWDTSAPTFSFE